MKNKLEFAASIICIDPLNIEKNIKIVDNDVDSYHFDFMDGIFVERYGVYPEQIRAVRAITEKPIEAHLMVNNSEPYLELLKDCGTDIISFHYENNNSIFKTIDKIKNLGMKASLVLNLHTPVNAIYDLIPYLDMIELMSINPGMLGSNTYNDVLINKSKLISDISNIKIAVDGGVRWNTIDLFYNSGISYQVAGSGILFNKESLNKNLSKIRKLKTEYNSIWV